MHTSCPTTGNPQRQEGIPCFLFSGSPNDTPHRPSEGRHARPHAKFTPQKFLCHFRASPTAIEAHTGTLSSDRSDCRAHRGLPWPFRRSVRTRGPRNACIPYYRALSARVTGLSRTTENRAWQFVPKIAHLASWRSPARGPSGPSSAHHFVSYIWSFLRHRRIFTGSTLSGIGIWFQLFNRGNAV